jgi:hypothetical protein
MRDRASNSTWLTMRADTRDGGAPPLMESRAADEATPIDGSMA